MCDTYCFACLPAYLLACLQCLFACLQCLFAFLLGCPPAHPPACPLLSLPGCLLSLALLLSLSHSSSCCHILMLVCLLPLNPPPPLLLLPLLLPNPHRRSRRSVEVVYHMIKGGLLVRAGEKLSCLDGICAAALSGEMFHLLALYSNWQEMCKWSMLLMIWAHLRRFNPRGE